MNKERKICAKNLVAVMVVEDLAKLYKQSIDDVLFRFMSSNLAEKLYSNKLKYWCDGPSSFIEEFKNEFDEMFLKIQKKNYKYNC